MSSDYFACHAHSEWSTLDGMGTVESMVSRASQLGQPALALTDHGTMAGSLRLYKQCQKAGIAPFPGMEAYVVRDIISLKEHRYHMGFLALDYTGYKALVRLSSRSHQRDRFHRKPLIDFCDLAELHDSGASNHIAVTTGCYFGLVVQAMLDPTATNGGINTVRMLQSWFPHLYVEVQNHGIKTPEHDDVQINELLFAVADELGLPVVLGQDSHYCNASDQPVHDLMKDICYFGDGEDNRFPGGPYHLASVKELKSSWTPGQWGWIEEGHADLLDKHALKMPALDKYKFHVPDVSKFPEKQLWRKVERGTVKRGIDPDWQISYRGRISYEMNVIEKMGMANYFLLVQEVTEWCRSNSALVNARGSVNGSLVCYLLRITEVDPLVWGTSFDRFLSLDRKKPPDIDLDVGSTDRERVIEHLRHKFPTMVGIGTYSRLGITEQEDADGFTEDKGSVFVQYMAANSRKDKTFDGKVRPEDRAALNKLADMNVRKALGAHAAGFVLPGKDLAIEDYLATALIPSSNTTVTQAVMEDVEDCGYVKLDILGLRALQTVNQALQNIGKTPNDWDWMKWDDKDTCKALRSGQCVGIFQFEGKSTERGGRQMKVKSTKDAILCLALYRPALMNGGQTEDYLRARETGKPPNRLGTVFDPILKDTCFVPVFQEQVMEMCKVLGMAYEDWNDLMKAVKASNDKIADYAEATMARIKPIFRMLCIKQGMSQEEATRSWDAVVGFTDYGFNRAHATSYGIMSYRSAYMKTHYPLEYMHALLNVWAGTKKEIIYVREARRMGIKIGRADVNISDMDWTIDPTKPMTIRRGLVSLKGIGVTAAQCIVQNRPDGGWDALGAMIEDCPARPVTGGKDWDKKGVLAGVYRVLRDHGALTSLGVDP